MPENTNYIVYLVELSQRGRKNAFLDLCEVNLKSVFTTAYRLTKDVDKSTYISIQTFLTVWDNIKSFDLRLSFTNWVKGISVKISLHELFKYEEKSGPIEIPSHVVFDNQKIEHLLLHLPRMERIIFVLHDFERYNYHEIRDFLEDLSYDEIKTILIDTRNFLMSKIGI
ncbi:MAG: hypothetical protein FJ214_05350 [Ignavibacteria bacterium]|nr:hypothetical protein [Ignavibacteria bacterium]